MQGVTKEPWGQDKKKFKFYKLDNCNKPVYESGGVTIKYFSKLTAFVSEKSVRFMFFNTGSRKILNLPL